VRASQRIGVPPYAFVALLFGVILRLTVIFGSPVRIDQTGTPPAYNDEYGHLKHIQYSAQQEGIPTFNESVHAPDALLRGDYEMWQPPLYYEIAAPLYRLTPTDLQKPILLRLLSLLFWGVALLTLLRALPDSDTRGPIILADTLLGISMIHAATVNNDSLFMLTASGLYLLAARTAFVRLDWKSWGVLVLVSAAAIYTKFSSMPLMVMVGVVAAVGTPGTWKQKTLITALTGATILLLTLSLWMLRYKTFGMFIGSAELNAFSPDLSLRELASSFLYSLQSPWHEYWGRFWVKAGTLLFLITSLVSLVWLFLNWDRFRAATMRLELDRVLLIWSAGAGMTLLGFLYYGLTTDQTDPRFLLGAGPVLALLLGAPLWVLPQKKAWVIGWGMVLLLVLPHLSWLGR